jgi:4-amino-4-deoxy-L-arabinose transferase-like glycosyltransferase
VPLSTIRLERDKSLIPKALSFFALAVLIAYAAARSLCQAATKPFWYDELCTFLMVGQQPISRMWEALKHGADGQPPGFYLVERFAVALTTNENIGFRWISIFAFSITVLCLFLLIRRRCGNMVALLCAAIPLTTALFDYFSVEARPYSLVVACIAFALLCYQRAPAAGWMVLLGLSLALAESFHYYAFFAFSPFLVAEGVLFLERRQFRWGVWLALSFGFLPLAAFWPLLATAKALYGTHFWSQPTFSMAEFSYADYFGTSPDVGRAIAAVAAVAILGSMLYASRREKVTDRVEETLDTSLQEPMMALTFLIVPFIAFAATAIAHGGLAPKYALSSVLGFPLAIGYVLRRRGGRTGALAAAGIACLFIFVLVPRETSFWKYHAWTFPSPAQPVESLARLAGHEELPVVVSDSHDFMQVAHYASPEWKERFVSVVDAPRAVAYSPSDNADVELAILANYSQLHVYDFRSFVALHPAFLLYSGNGGQGGDWWPGALKDGGYTLRPVAVKPLAEHDYMHRVFLVTSTKRAD